MSAPSGTVTAVRIDGENGADVAWNASDVDGDAVSVDIYVGVDGAGNDGVLVARGLPAVGSQRVGLGDVPPGTWHVFAVASDPRGGLAYAYAPGTVVIGGGGDDDARFDFDEPDGIGDIDADGIALITWETELPAGSGGSVALFVDGGNGEIAIAGGLAAAAVDEATPAITSFALDTKQLAPGQYTVGGVLAWDGGEIRREADGVLVVTADGCACFTSTVSRGAGPLPGVAVVAMLLSLVTTRRRRRG
jgi:hypothetical protein